MSRVTKLEEPWKEFDQTRLTAATVQLWTEAVSWTLGS